MAQLVPNTIVHGDCREVMTGWLDDCVDAIVTDPPYELGFMGKAWDRSGIAYSVELWREALRVLKPGGHLLAFGGSRTYHRLACAVEDAGFEIRDQIMWIYGSGFPKSLDVSKAIDKAAGVKREVAKNWQGWGTALKPAHEPIVVARKPLIGTVAENVLKHGTGAINVDGCRVETKDTYYYPNGPRGNTFSVGLESDGKRTEAVKSNPKGRWPANVIHDGSEEVLEGFPNSKSCSSPSDARPEGQILRGTRSQGAIYPGEKGSAARFFYCAKANKTDRGEGNTHPTVKPTDLMRYLCRLVTPSGGIILDPFAGSGSICRAAYMEGFTYIGVEIDADYCRIANGRLNLITAGLPICAALKKLEGR